MARASWTSLAEVELEEILYYIRVEAQRPETAARLGGGIHTFVAEHARRDMPGSRHPEFPADWLYVRYKRWLIAYVLEGEDMVVQRVLDSSRDLPPQFEQW
jgi:plasmid stabilization system protein ParE